MLHYNAGSCNGCDIEILACLSPKFDIEKFGMINTGNPKQSDVFLVTGPVTKRSRERIVELYTQMPEPKVVIAVGSCACTGGVFCGMYNVEDGIDRYIPVDVYIPGCAASPELIIDGVVRGLTLLEEKTKEIERPLKLFKKKREVNGMINRSEMAQKVGYDKED